MIRIKFDTDQDRIKGNYLLTTKSVVTRLRGDIFEIFDRDLKLLDEYGLHYTILPILNPSASDKEVRAPIVVEFQRWDRV